MTDQPSTPKASARPPCGNCGKPAFVLLDDFPVCIDCKYKVEQGRWMEFVQNATMLNHAEAELSSMMGMPSNQIAIPNTPIPPINYNHQAVTVTGGTVGVVNMGNVAEIQVNLQALTQNGSPDLVEPLKLLTEAILQAQDADDARKNEFLEQVAALTEQAKAKPEARKTGTIKALFGAVKEGASAVASVAGAWAAVEPLLAGHFGF